MSAEAPAWSRRSAVLALDDPADAGAGFFPPRWPFGSATGRGVRVAVIDSGVEAGHPLLGGMVDEAGGVAFSVDDGGHVARLDGPHDDVYGHGTACAGIIHALAPEATIVSVRVLDRSLQGSAAAFLAGLAWAVEQRFDVINLSLGATRADWALAFHDQCDRAYFANSFLVTAANNEHQESFPSLFSSVTSVAANHATDPWRFHANPHPPTEFLARGMNLEVAWRGGGTIVTTGNSFAAPHVAAFAALIKSQHPGLRPFQVKTALWAAAANVREIASPRPGASPGGDRPTATPSSSTTPVATAGRQGELSTLLPDLAVGRPVRLDPWGPVHEATTAEGEAVLVRGVDTALAAGRAVRARLLATVEILAGLRHPHLLPVLDVAASDTVVALVIPRSGASLAALAAEVRLTPPAATAVALSVLAGLGAAHAVGVLHGDLQPGNVVLDGAGRLVVADVGLAAALSSDVRTSRAPTDPGSWRWLAPEQLEGAPLGPYTDVHAVGLLLFELLAGELPFPPVTSLGALARQRAREHPRSLAQLAPSLAPALAAVADAATDPDPARRPPTPGALARALAAAADAAFGPGWVARQPFPLVGTAPGMAASDPPNT
ncbi:MAG: S8 family serine peptidase [Acidimicrobiales bacterium]